MKRFLGLFSGSQRPEVLLEAEVPPSGREGFEQKYKQATGQSVSPGNPDSYQLQHDKWGPELRVYFNDPAMVALLESIGIYVEHRDTGYKASQYQYRFNNNSLWWKLVNDCGLRLGSN